MSRSALHRQMQRQLREHHGAMPTSDPFSVLEQVSPQEEAMGSEGLPLHGNAKTLNMESVLATNIVSSKVFIFDVLPLETVEDVARDIPHYATHVEPWEPGVTPKTASAAFMYVYRLGVMRLTRAQLRRLLRWPDCLHVRAVALLWVRYTLPPAQQWDWFEPFLSDTTMFAANAGPVGVASSGAHAKQVSFGSWARGLLTDFHYYATLLPRTPVLLSREWDTALPLFEEDERRAAGNAKRMSELTAGKVVRARVPRNNDGLGQEASQLGEDEDGKAGDSVAAALPHASRPAAVNDTEWQEASVVRCGEGRGRTRTRVPLVWVTLAGTGSRADAGATADSDADASFPVELQDLEFPPSRPAPAPAPHMVPVRGQSHRGGDRDRGWDRDRGRGGDRDRDWDRGGDRDRDWDRGGDRDRVRDRDSGRGYQQQSGYGQGKGAEIGWRRDDRYDRERDRGDWRGQDRARSRSRSYEQREGGGQREGFDRVAVDDYDAMLRAASATSRPQDAKQGPAESGAGASGPARVPASLLSRYGSSAESGTSGTAIGGKGYRHEKDVEGAEDVIRHAMR